MGSAEAEELLDLQHRLFPRVGILLGLTAAESTSGRFHDVLLVFAGWTLCWISATIARSVYPPPRRWLESGRQQAD